MLGIMMKNKAARVFAAIFAVLLLSGIGIAVYTQGYGVGKGHALIDTIDRD